MIADSLHLVKRKRPKITSCCFYQRGNKVFQRQAFKNALDFKKRLESEGLASIVQLELYSKFQSNNAKRVKPF